MARALLATLGLTLLAGSQASEYSSELENHYNGYPHTVPNTAAGAQANQAAPNLPQVNSFIPLIFSYTATRPFRIQTPNFARNVSALVTVELNGGPGDIPTYLFNGQKPAVANNYPGLFGAKTAGRRLLADSITEAEDFANPIGNYGTCLGTVTATAANAYVPIVAATNSPSFADFTAAFCSGLKNLTNSNTARAGRRLHQALPIQTLKLYGEVKKSGSTGFPMLTYVFDFSSRPLLTLLSKPQPVGAIPPAGTLSFVDCVIFLPDGAFVRSKAGTCFDDSPVQNGVPQPVIVRLAAKSFYYGSGTLGANTGGNAGTQVAPIAAFSANYADTNGAPLKSVVYQMGNGGGSTIVQRYGVYADASGIYPGQT